MSFEEFLNRYGQEVSPLLARVGQLSREAFASHFRPHCPQATESDVAEAYRNYRLFYAVDRMLISQLIKHPNQDAFCRLN